jgi:hypothetical protein
MRWANLFAGCSVRTFEHRGRVRNQLNSLRISARRFQCISFLALVPRFSRMYRQQTAPAQHRSSAEQKRQFNLRHQPTSRPGSGHSIAQDFQSTMAATITSTDRKAPIVVASAQSITRGIRLANHGDAQTACICSNT